MGTTAGGELVMIIFKKEKNGFTFSIKPANTYVLVFFFFNYMHFFLTAPLNLNRGASYKVPGQYSKLSQPGGAQGDMTKACNVVSWSGGDPGTAKGH